MWIFVPSLCGLEVKEAPLRHSLSNSVSTSFWTHSEISEGPIYSDATFHATFLVTDLALCCSNALTVVCRPSLSGDFRFWESLSKTVSTSFWTHSEISEEPIYPDATFLATFLVTDLILCCSNALTVVCRPSLSGDFRSWESLQTLPAPFIGPFEHVI